MARKLAVAAALLAAVCSTEAAFADFIGINPGIGTTGPVGAISGTEAARITLIRWRHYNVIRTTTGGGTTVTGPAGVAPNINNPGDTSTGPDRSLLATAGGNRNFVDLDFDVYQLHSSFAVNLEVRPATSVPPAGDPVGTARYFFTVNMTNLLNSNGSVPGQQNHRISGFDVILTQTGGPVVPAANPTFNGGAPGFTATGPHHMAVNAPITPTFIRFGGLSGGGGQLLPGETQTLTFTIDFPGSSNITPVRSFQLAFVANPEPGTIALSTLLMSAGGVYMRRRRKSAALQAPTA